MIADFWPQDGQIYLPEIKYRRILNRAFGPGGAPQRPPCFVLC